MSYATTGFYRHEIYDLYDSFSEHLRTTKDTSFTFRTMSLFKALIVVLRYLRRNYTQAELGEMHNVSQPTISRVIEWVSPRLHALLADQATSPWKASRTPGSLLIDGTLVPTWDWKGHQENYSGKHRQAGLNVQVIADLSGQCLHVTAPMPGGTHDAKAYTESDIPGAISPQRLIGDKGYIGHLNNTPIRKKPGEKELPTSAKITNTSINTVRAPVERTIAHLKNWKILQTGYRGPLKKFKRTFELATRLHIFAQHL